MKWSKVILQFPLSLFFSLLNMETPPKKTPKVKIFFFEKNYFHFFSFQYQNQKCTSRYQTPTINLTISAKKTGTH